MHPESAKVLELVEKAARPPLNTLEVTAARVQFTETFPALDFPVHNDVPAHDVVLAANGRQVGARLYGRGSASDGVSFLFFHGGGWVLGDLDTHDRFCRYLAAVAGRQVLAVDYCRAPEHPFPAAHEDAAAAFKAVVRDANRLNIDPQRIIVAGDSAGGNLAASLALQEWPDLPFRPWRQWLVYPFVDLAGRHQSRCSFGDGHLLTGTMLDWFLDKLLAGGDARPDWRLSLLDVPVSVPAPPSAVIVLGGADPLHDEGLALARHLERAGGTVTLLDYPGMLHGFLNMQAVVHTARRALEESLVALFEPLPTD